MVLIMRSHSLSIFSLRKWKLIEFHRLGARWAAFPWILTATAPHLDCAILKTSFFFFYLSPLLSSTVALALCHSTSITCRWIVCNVFLQLSFSIHAVPTRRLLPGPAPVGLLAQSFLSSTQFSSCGASLYPLIDRHPGSDKLDNSNSRKHTSINLTLKILRVKAHLQGRTLHKGELGI